MLYLENAGLSPAGLVRAFRAMRWAGWFDRLAGVLVGRSGVADTTGADELRYDDALRSTLGRLACPVLVDADVGHAPPQMVLVNGAHAEVTWSAAEGGQIVQRFA